jgi:lipopolysaccharide transport system permease protein
MIDDEGVPTGSAWRVIAPPGRWPRTLGAAELWSHRELVAALVARDLRLRYRQTLLGVAWAVIQPLAAMAIFSLVFGSVAGLPSDGFPYPLFVLVGLAIWLPVASAVSAAADSLVEHRDLVTKVGMPRMLAPVAAVLAHAVDLLICLVLIVPVMALYGMAPPPAALTLPLWAGAGLLTAVGAGLWLSAANVLYRDVRYALGFLIQLWLFATPVVFTMSIVDESLRLLLALNPMAAIVDGFRWALLGAPAPGSWAAVSFASLALLLTSGALYFRSAERTFADRI